MDKIILPESGALEEIVSALATSSEPHLAHIKPIAKNAELGVDSDGSIQVYFPFDYDVDGLNRYIVRRLQRKASERYRDYKNRYHIIPDTNQGTRDGTNMALILNAIKNALLEHEPVCANLDMQLKVRPGGQGVRIYVSYETKPTNQQRDILRQMEAGASLLLEKRLSGEVPINPIYSTSPSYA